MERLYAAPLAWHETQHGVETAHRVQQTTRALYDFAQSQFIYLQSVVRLVGPVVALWLISPWVGVVAVVGYLVLAAIIVAFVSLVVMRVVPTFLEYQNIKKALVRAVSASGANNPEAIRSAFDRSQAIDDFHAIDSSKLIFSKDQGEQMIVSFKYSKDIPLFGPVKLVIDYEGDARAR